MRGTLNEVYDLKETRGWFKAKLTSLLLTLSIGIMILITIGFVAYGTKYIDSILPFHSVYLMEGLQWIVVLCLLLLAFALVYNFAPNHSPFQWKWISPGSVVGVVLWIVLSGGFRLYLHFFISYAATYGSLGAVIILLLWLYLTAFVILTGGAINAILDEKTESKKRPTIQSSGLKKRQAPPGRTKQAKARYSYISTMARKSILVVDDEKNQREILETILSGEGYDVTTASSGEAAMKFVADRHFDLVLTDLKMTGMSGLDLLKQLTDFDKSIIVILLTAHGSVDSAVDALRLGAFEYLQKPYDSEKLLETVSRALKNSPRSTPRSSPSRPRWTRSKS